MSNNAKLVIYENGLYDDMDKKISNVFEKLEARFDNMSEEDMVQMTFGQFCMEICKIISMEIVGTDITDMTLLDMEEDEGLRNRIEALFDRMVKDMRRFDEVGFED